MLLPFKCYRALFVSLLFAVFSPSLCNAQGFGSSQLGGTGSMQLPTSLQFGPDGRLYVSEKNGKIWVFTVARNAANDYSVTALEAITGISQIPNHNDDGTPNPSVYGRQVTGILVAGSAANPIIYVTSSDPRIGGAGSGGDLNLDTNSGILSKLEWDGSQWAKTDLVRGLPRSEENHAPNGMQLDTATNTLYIAQGGNTNMGAPSTNFAMLPEYAYSAAILSVDLDALGSPPYDLPTLDDEDRANTGGPPGFKDPNDPFGGNNGKNQAMLEVGGPVQVYSPGWRNAYDLLITTSGKMYTFDNGPNAGWGAPPASCDNVQSEPGSTYHDNLHLIAGQGYYGGHPNLTRGNTSSTFNPTNPQSPVPAALENPDECIYKIPLVEDGALTTIPFSTNGICEYTASNFGGAMQGNILAAVYDNNGNGLFHRIQLNAAGNQVTSNDTLGANFGGTTLDITALGDSGIFPGTIWVASIWGPSAIFAFEPNDYEGGGNCDPALPQNDEDGDCYTNEDEWDNGTDPCSTSSKPTDWDGDCISDMNDPDDDNDGQPDTSDPFALDPFNGDSTFLPIMFEWENNQPPDGGILGLGFTGLMTNGNTDYSSLYDPLNVTVGGAAGLFTIDNIPAGDAYGTNNDQAYGLQMGVNVGNESCPFTLRTRIVGAFNGIAPQDYQSMGIFIGDGTQGNYLKTVINANAGNGGIQVLLEESDLPAAAPASDTYTVPVIGQNVDLYITVDPAQNTATAAYSIDGGNNIDTLGQPRSIPPAWTSGVLAVGLISTSFGATPHIASWDLVEVTKNCPEPSFSVQITQPLGATAFAEPADITIAAQVTAPADTTIDKVAFFANGTYLGEDATEPYTFDWLGATAGSYILTAEATSSSNETRESPPINISVAPPAGNITASITSPPDGSVFYAPANIPITALATQTGASSVYLQLSNPSLGWKRGRLGYDPSNLWNPKQNVVAGGNNSLKFVLKDLSGTVQWDKLELLMQGAGTPVLLSNHIASATPLGDGWLQLDLPLSLFGSVDLTQVSFVEFFSKGAAYFEIGIGELVFEGGATPFEWFGPNKNDNSSNTDLQFDLMTGGGSVEIEMMEFFANGILVGTDDTAPFSYDWNTAMPGIYDLTATADLVGGGIATTEAVQVSVSDLNVEMLAPANDSAFFLGDTIPIEAAATSSASIAQVAFYANGILLGTDTSPPYTVSWTPSETGGHDITAAATDTYNGNITSLPVSITINEPSTPNISINTPLDGQSFPSNGDILIVADAGGTGEPTYLGVSNPLLGWRRGRLGYNPQSIWNPKQNVVSGGNNTLILTLKDLSGTTDWSKLEVLMQGTGTPVLLSNHIGNATPLDNGWLQLELPLGLFGSVDLTQVSFMEFFAKGAPLFQFGLREITFAGGTTPFEWFGPNKNDNSFNAQLQFELVPGSSAAAASLVEFYANGNYLGSDDSPPFEHLWPSPPDGTYELTVVGTYAGGVVETSAPVNITVGAGVLRINSALLLEGNMEEGGDNMRTDLKSEQLLPLEQPFDMPPWNYGGNEGFTEYVDMPDNVSDWVLMEIHLPGGLGVVERQAALLLGDGTITSALDPPLGHVRFESVADNEAYILVVRSRNHLPAMSATALLPDGGEISLDFSGGQDAVYGGYLLKPVGNGKFALVAGDANGDGAITVHDLNLLRREFGDTLYSGCDANCDGSIGAEDFFLLLQNSGLVAPKVLRY